MREIADIIALYERRRSERFVLATLVRATGSSYRRPGARMLIAGNEETAGSLSGGCLEEEVVARAREVKREKRSSLMTFDTRRRFGCHGVLEIYVELAKDRLLRDLAMNFHGRKQSCVITDFEGGDASGSELSAESEPRLTAGFLQVIDPEIQLLIVGDGPDSVALRGFATTLGWRIQIMTSASEITGPFDAWTAALVETHNYGRDFAALRALSAHELRYVGLVGPRRRRDQLLADLMDTGVSPGPNLFAPAGLDLGADSPEQIALAIIAEIQGVFSGGSLQSLRDRKAPIHAVSREARTAPVPVS